MQFQALGFGAAIFMTLLCMGAVGILVVIPIACIQLAWNSLMTSSGLLPAINSGQATLLYLAVALLVYLSGIVSIEFKSEPGV